MSRPTSQHRLSVGASNLPARNAYARSHSHTISLGSVGTNNRINRRKSSTFSPAAHAAVIGAAVESAVADGSVSITNRRSSVSRAALGSLNDGTHPPVPSSLPQSMTVPEESSSAVVDGPSLSSFQGVDRTKQRMRRASDGTRLTKKEKAATGDMKCEHCGKAYKHGSCLSKHLWEHSPHWQYTSKLMISKHQQVQLLEAASVLVTMNGDGPTNDSDNSSSPAFSGSSERDDDLSSAETTPPPQADNGYRDPKRYSGNSSAYSRSYQSVFSEDMFSHHRQWSNSSNRPSTAHTSIAETYRDEDPQDLAAAVGLLSCSYGTPKSGPTGMPSDIPPVPPLPEKYALEFSNYRGGREDVIMDDDDSSEGEIHSRRAPQYEEEEGFFGRMD